MTPNTPSPEAVDAARAFFTGPDFNSDTDETLALARALDAFRAAAPASPALVDAERKVVEAGVWRVLERLTLASETLLSSDPDMPSHHGAEDEHEAATDEARALLSHRAAQGGEVTGG